ncbi:hypothetical protein V6N12_038543 [Hibiscus sabdariffa]|uniref:Uncharacterized protein n=1 Tax=Hibiscus sabdariffa TaxID=183260 RepID=A0ABR2A9C8_9ROSI
MRQEGCHNEDRVANVPDRISDEQVGMINRLYMDMGLNVDVLSCELEVNCVGSLQDKPNSVERAPSDIAKIQSKCVRTSYIVNGGSVEGPIVVDGNFSFLGELPLPIRSVLGERLSFGCLSEFGGWAMLK